MKKLIYMSVLLSSLALAKDYALIVGMSDYKNIIGLSSVANDIGVYKKILKDRGIITKNIKILKDKEATKSAIEGYLQKTLDEMKKSRSKNNRFFMFFAGHGISIKYLKDNSSIVKGGFNKFLTNSGAILPYDYNPKAVANTVIIGKRDLRPILIKIDKYIHQSLIVFDACYSGNSIRGKRFTTPFIYSNSKDYPYKNIVYIASSTPRNRAKSGVLSRVLSSCMTKNRDFKELKVCMNGELKNIGQRVTMVLK